MAAGTWQEGSFLDNLAAAADALGHENVGAAWGLAGIEWASREDREGFLNALTKVPWSEMQEGTRG
jgi:hypothetical protein